MGKYTVIVWMILCPLCAALQALEADEGATNRPNILFLLIDDQRNYTLGCAGHPIVKTPVIDSLAESGVRFENAFVTTSICAASRASILTGLHERTHGYTFIKPPLKKKHMLASYPALIRQSGYRTGFIGKYGFKLRGQPESEMFDVFRTHDRNPYFKKQPDGSLRHETEIAGDRAIEFLKANSKGKPFCLSVSFNAVHAEDSDRKDHYPWPKAVDGMYDDVVIPAPRLSDPAIFENYPNFLKNSMNRQRYHWRWLPTVPSSRRAATSRTVRRAISDSRRRCATARALNAPSPLPAGGAVMRSRPTASSSTRRSRSNGVQSSWSHLDWNSLTASQRSRSHWMARQFPLR
jgi:arylsulfatase A-like enzyme